MYRVADKTKSGNRESVLILLEESETTRTEAQRVWEERVKN